MLGSPSCIAAFKLICPDIMHPRWATPLARRRCCLQNQIQELKAAAKCGERSDVIHLVISHRFPASCLLRHKAFRVEQLRDSNGYNGPTHSQTSLFNSPVAAASSVHWEGLMLQVHERSVSCALLTSASCEQEAGTDEIDLAFSKVPRTYPLSAPFIPCSHSLPCKLMQC